MQSIPQPPRHLPTNSDALQILNLLKRRRPEQIIALLEQQQSHHGARKRTRVETQTPFSNTKRSIVTITHPEKVHREEAKTCSEVKSPVAIVKAFLGENVIGNKTKPATSLGDDDDAASFSFTKPTKSELSAYAEMVDAMRKGDLDKLKGFHAEGKSLDACNQFGESLIHMACRRGNLDIVNFLIDEAKVRVVRRDDFGRMPLHDATWTSEPNFDVMDKLLATVPPSLLLAEDVRGHTCFDYARREHWGAWVNFLNERKSMLQERLEQERSEAN
mmetsp:Transcript_43698/g.64879  ORF Transcript_43698/g.64879 Transcript_43698/m.64879 type:complete len:274 (-) Transcript_43698:92-913(-)|eukprot:CAMPEP_0194045986 /NCGR_PEP_ID=MMETSP0009_2-20130614/19097_1 /TAXON_ID=210454 /ORGANISM="Grammatophora oceanica, Strain CCMP 410" /LENGTH=273 /DNA_ID=CAMNT_0038691067 /DNA_START=76 /DNA_END=897 /DNA_ORIENTATION=-